MSKWILITGATGGIGETTARYLHEEGYSLILTGRNKEKLSCLEQELGPNTYVFPYDLRDLYNIESIFNYISDNDIKLDGFVHAAGINRDIAIRSNDIEAMQEVTTINYMSFVELMKYFLKKKHSNNGAVVVAISSIAVLDHPKAMCTYAASKSALESAVIIASKEAIKREIRVNAIRPGFVNTEMTANVSFSIDERVSQIQPLGLIDPIYISYMVEYLLSEKSKYITGSMIPMMAGFN